MPKTSSKVKRPLRGTSRKRASSQTPSPSAKSKRSRRPTLHRLNEALNRKKSRPKTSRKVKRPLQGRSRKTASRRSASPSIKSKRSKGPILYGHYRRLNETLKRYENESEEDQGAVRPTTSRDYWSR